MKKIRIILSTVILLLSLSVSALAQGYANYPPMPDKYLLPDGSIQTFSGVVYAPASTSRATTYATSPLQIAKWLLPDGSIVAALPFSGGGSGSLTKIEVDAHASQAISATQMSNTIFHNVGQVADSVQTLVDFVAGLNFIVAPTVAVAKKLWFTPSSTAGYNVICTDSGCCGAGKSWGWLTVTGTEHISCISEKTATGYRVFCSEISGSGACEQ
jgi:hypothetical protein